ncbi:MAG: diaminopimelate epimerase [Oscillospiraceae bacterium]|jgi:diaminopimelate epimerase
MKFTKMHGIGNDYIYVNCFEEQIEDRPALARKLSDRHFGVGGDGLICICPSDIADFKMDMYNADGSQSAMCGNGIRCVAKYVYDRGMTDKTEIKIESGGTVKTIRIEVRDGVAGMITVDMGIPDVSAVGESITVLDKDYVITRVDMGNPHAVLFMDDISDFDIERIGSAFEKNKAFPNRTNVEFVKVLDNKTIQMRVWERGTGETLACGTGACAAMVAAVLGGFIEREADVRLPGGELSIRWDEKNGHVYMTGPAEFVFDGVLL